jgi:DNA-3-methyladenine glycosylase I
VSLEEDGRQRCGWAGNDPLMVAYHDEEWGVPVHDDRKLFEYIVLDTFQAGLSWRIILNKRMGFDAAFAHFVPEAVAAMTPEDVERLVGDTGIVRNRMKIAATIVNAQKVAEVQAEFGSLEAFLWSFVGNKTLLHRHEAGGEVEATSPESDALSKAMKARGFKFAGSTVCYAFMQSAGMINDHLVSCFRYHELVDGR